MRFVSMILKSVSMKNSPEDKDQNISTNSSPVCYLHSSEINPDYRLIVDNLSIEADSEEE